MLKVVRTENVNPILDVSVVHCILLVDDGTVPYRSSNDLVDLISTVPV